MLGVTPYIAFAGGQCRQAIEFYKSALGAEVLFLQTVGDSPMSDMGAPASNIMHASIRVGDSTVMMCDDFNPDPAAGKGRISLALGLDNVEKAKQLFQSLSEGGSVVMPLEKTFWAESFGIVADRFGVTWLVNCEAPANSNG